MPIIVVCICVVLLISLQNYAYKKLWDKGLGFKVLFSHREVFEGDELQIQMELTNKKFLPLPWVVAKTEMSKGFLFNSDFDELSKTINKNTDLLTSIMMYSIQKKRRPLVCLHRGVFRLYSAKLHVSNLLHTEEFSKDIKLGSEILVFPKTLDNYKNIDLIYKKVDSAIQSKAIIDPDPFEFKGIREYQPTDPLKSVNFKATAISQKLMVNINAPTNAFKLTIVLNVEETLVKFEWAIYEQSIRLAATLAKYYIENNASVGFITNGRDTATGEELFVRGGTSGSHMYNIYEGLARVALRLAAKPMTTVLDELTDREQVFLIISPIYNQKLIDAYSNLKERQVNAHMIIPYFRRPDMVLPSDVTIWDAHPG